MNKACRLQRQIKSFTLAAQPRGAIAEMPKGEPLEPDPDYTGGGMVLTPQAGVISVCFMEIHTKNAFFPIVSHYCCVQQFIRSGITE
jgi:hypothetical protein